MSHNKQEQQTETEHRLIDSLGRDSRNWPEIWRRSRRKALRTLNHGGFVPADVFELDTEFVDRTRAEIHARISQLTPRELLAVSILLESLAGPQVEETDD